MAILHPCYTYERRKSGAEKEGKRKKRGADSVIPCLGLLPSFFYGATVQ